jgi:paraquat-inducible protein B
MDPRSGATPEVLQQQLQIGRQAYAETLEARRALAEIGSVQKRLLEVEQKLGEQNPTLKSALAEAQSELAKILSDKRASQQEAGLQDGYSGLASALRVIESGDRAVPSQAIALYKESSQRAKEGIAKWTTFKQMKLPQLNRKLREGKFDPIAISEIELEVQFLMSR